MDSTVRVDAPPPDTPLHERVTALLPTLSASERRAAEYMAGHPDEVAASSSVTLGKITQTSDATIVRTAKALGYAGFRELRRAALDTITRRRDPAAVLDHRLGRLGAGDQELDRVLADTVDLLQQLRQGIDSRTWQAAVDAILEARSVLTYGIGPASMLAEYLSILLVRVGIQARSLTLTGFRLADGLLGLAEGDTVVVFGPLRQFREIEVVLDHARAVGARVVLVSEALGLSLRDRVDVVLATPQSTTTTASESTTGFVLAHALMLSVASRTPENSVHTMELLNQLRASVAGAELDVRPLPPEEGPSPETGT